MLEYPEYDSCTALFVVPALIFAAFVCATRLLDGPSENVRREAAAAAPARTPAIPTERHCP
jgi:hypothetical protein